MTAATARQTFRDVLAQVVEHAQVLLPEQVNGRLESATKLVLNGDVFCKDDGSVEVGSSDPTRYYRLVGSACTCTDFVQEKAPQGMCKHKIAANLLKSVERVLARSTTVVTEPAPEVVLPEPMEPFADNDPEPEAVEPLPTPAPAPAPLPEARSSVNVHVTIAGRDCQLTLRDHDEQALLARLEAVLARYPMQAKPQAPQAPAVQGQDGHWCRAHQVQMIENQKNGQRWYSHRLPEGGFCKGR